MRDMDDEPVSLQEMVFDDLEPVQVVVRIKGKAYILLEASEDAAVKFRNASMRACKMVDGEVVGLDGGADVEVVLVTQCLYEAASSDPPTLRLNRDGEPDPRYRVNERKVRSWPARVVKELFDKCRAISQLEETKETEESLLKKIARLQRKLNKLRASSSNREGEYVLNETGSDPTMPPEQRDSTGHNCDWHGN